MAWIPTDGFEWGDGPSRLGSPGWPLSFERWLIAKSAGHDHDIGKEYPSLYRLFAALERDEDAFLAFANRFGFLGLPESREITPDVPEGETYSSWRYEVGRLKNAVRLWDSFREKDYRSLRNEFFLSDPTVRSQVENDPVAVWWQPDYQWGTSIKILLPHSGQRLTLRELDEAALHVIKVLVDWGLEHTSSRLEFDRAGRKARIDYGPSNLVGLMWLQFARAIAQDLEPRVCAYSGCNNMFDPRAQRPGARGVRSNRKYCSEQCRWNANNRRRPPKGVT